MKTVNFNLKDVPELTDKDKAELLALSDDQIDFSDQEELTVAQLAAMSRGEFFKPVKKQITARLDADVLHWLKSKGKGYQTRMNAILREAMQCDR